MWKACAIALFALFVANASCFAQAASAPPANEAQLLRTAESFVRELYAWGPDVQIKLGPLAPSAAAGRPLVVLPRMRGLNVTLVEFADFECPHCEELYESLKAIEGKYPQIRIVYKDFPLTNIHPWANTAAVAGRCAFEQSEEGFWKVHDMIFDRQDVISPENVWDKLVSFAAEGGLNADTFKACLASPDAQKAVDANRADGAALGVNSTPTVYVNGRPVVGGSPVAIDRDIAFELAQKDATQKN